jgi:hypothetical protein
MHIADASGAATSEAMNVPRWTTILQLLLLLLFPLGAHGESVVVMQQKEARIT